MKYIKYLLAVPFFFVALGCARQNSTSLIERHYQFSMTIGKMEDQIDLIQLPGQPFTQIIDLVMQNGLFYISNGAAGKVMEFTSYGDLLTLYYNKSTNPAPVLFGSASEDGAVVNRKAIAYPFIEVGSIAVTESGMLLVEDTVAKDRRRWDDEIGTLLRTVVLRFDSEGRLVDYIGQEGISGTPFGYIDSISVGIGDELTVITRTIDKWLIYTYDSAGLLRYTFSLTEENLPTAAMGEVMSLDVVMAAPETDRLYVKVDYYGDELASGDEKESDYRFVRSSLHWLDMRAGTVTGSLDLPRAVRTSGMAQMFNREEEESIYYFAGVSEGGYAFFVSPATEELYSFVLLNLSGLVVHRGTIDLNDSETLYRKFYVTRDGILTVFLGGNTKADIVLWRTDKYLSGEE